MITMKLGNYIVVATILTALVGSGAANAASADKNKISQRGGRAAEHMSTKGSVNTNAQWSADPERGWVRAEERHKEDKKNGVTSETKKPNAKPKGKGKIFNF
jgi:hypothetical protein